MNHQLRVWTPEDIPSLTFHINNINIWNNTRDGLPHPYTEEDAENFIKMNMEHEGPAENFAIDIDGKAVGGVGFVMGSDVERISAEIGYWLGEQYWGRGIMTSAVQEAVKYAFETLPVMRIYAGVFEYNIPSMKSFGESRFQKRSHFEKSSYQKWQDTRLSLLCSFKRRRIIIINKNRLICTFTTLRSGPPSWKS